MYARFKWIEYSEITDSVYCFKCRHFTTTTAREKVYTEDGFRQWNKCYGVHKEENRLLKHELSDAHAHAENTCDVYMVMQKSSKTGNIVDLMGDANKKLVEENRHYLKTICEVLRLTAVQKIAQRESGGQFRVSDIDRDSLSYGTNCGNFLAILALVAKHDPIVAKKYRLDQKTQHTRIIAFKMLF